MPSTVRSQIVRALGVALVVSVASQAMAEVLPVDGPCRIKLRSGRIMEARGLQPVDAKATTWRISLGGDDSLVVPARELKKVEVLAVESCGNPDAVSRKGAVGLMQLMPATARDYGCSNPRDPSANVEAGCAHLARLVKKLVDLPLVLAAYNAGEGAVEKSKGIPKFRETQSYVTNVLAHRTRLSESPPAM